MQSSPNCNVSADVPLTRSTESDISLLLNSTEANTVPEGNADVIDSSSTNTSRNL